MPNPEEIQSMKICAGKSLSQVASLPNLSTTDFAKCLFGLTNHKGKVIPNAFACNQCNMRKGTRDVTLVVHSDGDRFLVENGGKGGEHYVWQIAGDFHEPDPYQNTPADSDSEMSEE